MISWLLRYENILCPQQAFASSNVSLQSLTPRHHHIPLSSCNPTWRPLIDEIMHVHENAEIDMQSHVAQCSDIHVETVKAISIQRQERSYQSASGGKVHWCKSIVVAHQTSLHTKSFYLRGWIWCLRMVMMTTMMVMVTVIAPAMYDWWWLTTAQ